jgi:hypothetical protein
MPEEDTYTTQFVTYTIHSITYRLHFVKLILDFVIPLTGVQVIIYTGLLCRWKSSPVLKQLDRQDSTHSHCWWSLQ